MTKRKLSGGEAAPAKEPEAADVEEQEEEFAPGPIDLNPLQFLIAPTDVSNFTSEIWERKPLHIPADEERKKFFDGLFNFDELARVSDALEAGVLLLMDQDPGPKGDALSLEDDVDDQMCREIGPLMFGRDVMAVRYIDGKRETISGDVADSDTLRALHESAGATLQLHQPQRFVNGLWRLVAALEAQAGCLVGCNAYVTPKNGQGLAPHHDDVELFVCQTQGSKRWRLYKPVNGFELPSKCSGDLPQEVLGEPILEVTMKPGDVLYVPRGTVHQAEAQDEGSCHLTISTFQHWTWGSLAGQLIKTAAGAQDSPACALPLELRKGLPMGFVFKHGFQAEMQAKDNAAAVAAVRPDAASLASGLRALADQLEKNPLELLTPAVDELSLDFLLHRMPPHPAQLPDQGEEPGLEDSIACRGKNLFRLVPFESPEGGMSDEEDEDEEEDEEKEKEGGKTPLIKLVTCLGNSRFSHMISADKDEEEEEEEEGNDHENDELGMCGLIGCGGSDEEEEEEEEEEENEEPKCKKAGKKCGKDCGKAAEDKEEAEEEKVAKKGKKGGEKKAEEEVKAEKEEEEEGDEPEIMDVDLEGEEGEGDSEDDEDEEGDDSDDNDEEDEEKELEGPIFPAHFAPCLLEVLSSSLENPLPVKKLQVPGGDADEQVRLAQLLHEWGFVATVPGVKKAEPSPVPKEQAKAAGKKGEKAEGEKAEEGKKAGKKAGKETPDKAEGEKAGKGKGKAKEEAAKEEAKEKAGGSPPAKKAKKAGK